MVGDPAPKMPPFRALPLRTGLIIFAAANPEVILAITLYLPSLVNLSFLPSPPTPCTFLYYSIQAFAVVFHPFYSLATGHQYNFGA